MGRSLAASLCLIIAGLLLKALPVAAHDLGVARVAIQELAPGQWLVQAKLPENIPVAAPVFPGRCVLDEGFSIALPEKNRRDTWTVTCGGDTADQEQLVFPWKREGVLLSTAWLDGAAYSRYVPGFGGVATIDFADLRSSGAPWSETVTHYFVLGIEHILMGWDHLAFVLALCLIATGWALVRLVTFFTLGHSVTLALATLGWVNVPVPPTEVCIALSVAFVAREAIRTHAGESGHGALLVLAFGLLHGLGFASALHETGIREQDLLWGLLSFNLGVEAGQLVFIAAVTALALLTGMGTHRPLVRTGIAFLLGTLAMFWTMQRLALFGS